MMNGPRFLSVKPLMRSVCKTRSLMQYILCDIRLYCFVVVSLLNRSVSFFENLINLDSIVESSFGA